MTGRFHLNLQVEISYSLVTSKQQEVLIRKRWSRKSDEGGKREKEKERRKRETVLRSIEGKKKEEGKRSKEICK